MFCLPVFQIYRTIILPVVLYGCDTWSLILQEEHRLRVFENKGLGKILRPKWGLEEIAGIMRGFTICISHKIFGWQNQDVWYGWSLWYVRERGKVHKRLWWASLRERAHLEYLGIDGRIMLKWILNKLDGGRGLHWYDSEWLQVASCLLDFEWKHWDTGTSTASQITQLVNCTCNLGPFLHVRLNCPHVIDDKIREVSSPNVIIRRVTSLRLS